MRFFTYVPALVCALVLAGCGGKKDDVIVNPDVHVVDAAARERLEQFEIDMDNGAGTLRFEAGTPGIEGLEPGRVLVSEPVGEVAPYGFLQRIRSKRTEGDSVVFDTEQVTLEEVFEQADILYEVELKPEQLVSAQTYHPGVRLEAASVSNHEDAAAALADGNHVMAMSDTAPRSMASKGFNFAVTFDETLIDRDGDPSTTDDQLTIDGSFNFNAGVEMSIKIGTEYVVIPVLERAKFVASLDESVNLNLRGALAGGFDTEIEVASLSFGVITVFIGPIPVVFSIGMDITIGASGHINATLTASATQSLSFHMGVQYIRDRGWRTLSGFESDFDVPPPELELTGTARAFARPELMLALYGIAGPTASATAYAELDVALNRDPFWEMTGGVDVGVGLKAEIPIIGKEVRWSNDFELFRRSIGVSRNQAPSLEVLSPSNGHRQTEAERLSFTVRASDREQEVIAVNVKLDGQVVGSEDSVGGEDVVVGVPQPCPGTYTYEVSVTDAKGETVRRTITVVVENDPPVVLLATGSLEGWPAIPGGFLFAYAEARDRTCNGDTAAQNLIQWRINGEPVGSSGELSYHIPASAQIGDTLLLQAFYDDGELVAESYAYPLEVVAYSGTNNPPHVVIEMPTPGPMYLTSYYTLVGRAQDVEDGLLGPESVTWRIRFANEPETGGVLIPYGTPSMRLQDIYPGLNGVLGDMKLSLEAEDSQGAKSDHTLDVFGTING